MQQASRKSIGLLGRSTIAAAIALILIPTASSQQDSNKTKKQYDESPAGTWRGESRCLVRPSACNDENAVYRIRAGQPLDRVTVSAGKVVEGREITMGSGDCRHDRNSRFIDCTLPNGNSVHLEIHGNAMEGKMTLRDGTLWRRISLRRAEEK